MRTEVHNKVFAEKRIPIMLHTTDMLRLPAQCTPLAREELDTVTGGEGFDDVLNNISKISKVFNYMARFFSSTSAMLNNFITAYNTLQDLNNYIQKNF